MARKSNRAVEDERRAILMVLRDAPAALQYEQIRRAYAARTAKHIAYTTLRVRLDELLAAELVERSSARRNPTYRLSARMEEAERLRRVPREGGANPAAVDAALTTAGEPGMLLSEQAEAARALVLRPRTQRPPVSYHVEFLDAYEPGTTWYLPSTLRSYLKALGQTAYVGEPAGTYARDIIQRLIIDLSWGSSRLEGNKYSRIDTEELLTGGREANGASDRDRQMILNHKAAIEFLVENAQQIGFDRYTVLGLHALLSENLLGNPEDEGELRSRPIGIGNSVYTPTAIPQLIDEHFRTMLEKAGAIPDPMEQAFFMMVHLPYLQPFIDVNKRTSRLSANISLIKANLCPLSFVDVPEATYTQGTLAVYESNDVSLLRDVFAWAYERSCAQFKVLRQAMGDPDPIRLNYRAELRALVADIVRGRLRPTEDILVSLAKQSGVPTHDQGAFVVAARRDLRVLRPDILARYQLRMSEFDAWKQATDTPEPQQAGA
ncbi:Fic family protein [Gemmatimonas sp.]|uniref:Fic family protein n=1 Tax=Gemmatimonas sp. TaxID=1962908 RepID=UPI003DA3B387